MKNKMEYAYAGGASADTGSTFGLSGAALKWIAMISMLIDHIGAVVVEYGLYYQGGAECFQKLLEKDTAESSIRLPEKLEQIYVDGDDLYVLFESAAYSYRASSLVKMDRILKLDLKTLLP